MQLSALIKLFGLMGPEAFELLELQTRLIRMS
jgi:hypothetical protein